MIGVLLLSYKAQWYLESLTKIFMNCLQQTTLSITATPTKPAGSYYLQAVPAKQNRLPENFKNLNFGLNSARHFFIKYSYTERQSTCYENPDSDHHGNSPNYHYEKSVKDIYANLNNVLALCVYGSPLNFLRFSPAERYYQPIVCVRRKCPDG